MKLLNISFLAAYRYLALVVIPYTVKQRMQNFISAKLYSRALCDVIDFSGIISHRRE